MGKTNLIPLLTYFTQEEAIARKAKAKESGLSLSNFNRMELDYPVLKQGKPRKNLVQPETRIENNIEVEVNTKDEFLEVLPTTSDLEIVFDEIVIALDNLTDSSMTEIGKSGEIKEIIDQQTSQEIIQPRLF